ncbi:MAG: tripartite tricarboxylate transporter substrate binding protein [Betaproteobacteria bacterium]|nr:tripartite tricarboxylate transporter substrate binding protein [Betaproteobacteria bacterium]
MKLFRVFAAIALAALTTHAAAQAYPNKAVKIIVPFPPAGATDVVTRFLGQKLGEKWSQSVVIENRPGAGGSIGSDLVAKAPHDGYTLLMATSSTHSIGPSLSKLPYDPIKDFAPIIHVADVPNVLVVSPMLPVKDMKELIELAKSKPGQLNFASSGNGTIVHLNAELFKMIAGIDVQHIPYKGTALATPDLASGQISMMFDSLASVMPNIRSGRAKPLAVNARGRSPLLPDVPTLAEAGMPAFDRYTWFGMFAPAGTPKEIVAKVRDDVTALLRAPDLLEKFASVGAEPTGGTSEAFVARILADTAKWAQVIKTAKVKIE